MRARKSSQITIVVQKFERPEVDLLVTAHGIAEGFLATGKGGGIENDQVEGLLAALEIIEGVGLNGINLQAVESSIVSDRGDGLG